VSKRPPKLGEIVTGRVLSTDPIYIAAYGIAVTAGELEFPLAYALAQLVIRDQGGPVVAGKSIKKRSATSLKLRGWVTVHKVFPERFELVLRPGWSGHLKVSHIALEPAEPGKATTYVTSTQQGVDLVELYAPETPPDSPHPPN